MRELLFKNFLSRDRKRSELFLSEHFEQNGVTQDMEKKIKYNVKEILEFTDVFDLELFLEQKRKEDAPVQTFIIKTHNTKLGKTKFLYKMVGNQYLVIGNKIIVLKITQYIQQGITQAASKYIEKSM